MEIIAVAAIIVFVANAIVKALRDSFAEEDFAIAKLDYWESIAQAR